MRYTFLTLCEQICATWAALFMVVASHIWLMCKLSAFRMSYLQKRSHELQRAVERRRASFSSTAGPESTTFLLL